MWSRAPRAACAALASVALVAALAACDDDPKGAAPGDPTAAPPSPAGSTATGEPASPTVEPATGEVLEVATLSLRLVEGLPWQLSSLGTLTVSGGYLTDEGYGVTVRLSDIDSATDDLAEDAAAFIRASRNDPRPRPAGTRVIDGVESWVATGRNADYDVYWVGGVHAGRAWSLEVETPRRLAEAEQLRERIIASIDFTT